MLISFEYFKGLRDTIRKVRGEKRMDQFEEKLKCGMFHLKGRYFRPYYFRWQTACLYEQPDNELISDFSVLKDNAQIRVSFIGKV